MNTAPERNDGLTATVDSTAVELGADMAEAIDGRAGRLDVVVQADSDMPALQVQLLQDDGTPVDLTNSIVSVVSATSDVPPVRITWGCVVSSTPADGTLVLTLVASEVARMRAPSSVGVAPRLGGTWALEADMGGVVVPLLFGEIRVQAAPPRV